MRAAAFGTAFLSWVAIMAIFYNCVTILEGNLSASAIQVTQVYSEGIFWSLILITFQLSVAIALLGFRAKD